MARLRALSQGGLFLALVVTLALVLVLGHRYERSREAQDPDLARIEEERGRRRMLAAAGLPLDASANPIAPLDERLRAAGVKLGAPVFMRIFKLEFELEMWLRRGDRFVLVATYPICRWSGQLGPKLNEGDGQAPEGFYTVDATQLNPRSRWHRAFNLGFPNVFDRTHRRTGTFLMVHGGCSSVGCFAMTDPVIDELWRIVAAALKAGQPRFHVHVLPFRMTQAAIEARKSSPWAAFWADLKPAYDRFEAERLPPRIAVCDGRYSIAPGDPASHGRPVSEACRQREADNRR